MPQGAPGSSQGLSQYRGHARETKTYAMSTFGDTTQNQAGDTTRPQPPGLGRPPLRRAYNGRMIAGVCAGIADYLAIDVTLVRVAFAVFTFLGLPASRRTSPACC